MLSGIKKYVRMMRLDHWIKQSFIIPGCFCAYILCDDLAGKVSDIFFRLFLGLVGASLIASANYVINEWLDADHDRYHPVKKNRSAVTEDINGRLVWLIWFLLTVSGGAISISICREFFLMCAILWVMGILYNVKPFRLKDIPFVDVLTESVNNAIRFLMGWYMVAQEVFPPSSIVLGYWMAGAFLMSAKRYAEFRMIGDSEIAAKYRRPFKYYDERSLLICCFFYAMSAVFLMGVFLIKYRIELVLFMPVLMGLFCVYLWISFKEDSAVQKPEKLYHEKGLMLYIAVLIVWFVVLLFIDVPWTNIFVGDDLIKM